MQDKKLIQEIIKDIEKSYGQRTIFTLDQNPVEVEVVSTGCYALNKALGINGFPACVIEIYGPAGSSKTTLALSSAAEVQKLGGRVLFVDAEYALNKNYAMDLGVKFDDTFHIVQPTYTEQAIDIIERFLEKEAVDLIILDSLAALSPKAEIEGEINDSHMGLQARIMSQFFRRSVQSIKNTKLIIINQIRDKMNTFGYGETTTTTGGNALKFYSKIRLDVKRVGHYKVKNEIVGQKVKVKVIKNKYAPPFQEAEFDLIFGKGIDNEGTIIDEAVNKGLIEKGGSWYSYGDKKIGQGKDAVSIFLKDNPDIYKEIMDKL